jgi:hypothetical protein
MLNINVEGSVTDLHVRTIPPRNVAQEELEEYTVAGLRMLRRKDSVKCWGCLK